MNEVIKSGHLKGSYRCSFKREHDIPLETGKRKENVYDKAVLIKEIIKNGIYHGYDKEQIKESIIYSGYHSVLDEFTDPYLWMEDIPWFIRLVEYRAYEAASDIRAIEPLI